MKELILMRHAKSDWDNTSQSDHERPLNKRGQADAPFMGRFMKNQYLMPDAVFVSSARRAQQTFQLWCQGSDFEGTTVTRREFYLSSPGQYLAQLQGFSGDDNRLMIIGHNPVMEQLTAALIGYNAEANVCFPTAAIAYLELHITSWSQIREGCGVLQWMVNPKMLKKMLN